MAHPDLDQLLNVLLPFAQQQLAKQGSFAPFGASITMDGEVALTMAAPEEGPPDSAQMIEMMRAGLSQRADAREIRAAGICADTLVQSPGATEKSDAIRVQLERVGGESVDVYMPYRRGILGRVKYGELTASPGTANVFRVG